jgi:hypothetical protein
MYINVLQISHPSLQKTILNQKKIFFGFFYAKGNAQNTRHIGTVFNFITLTIKKESFCLNVY